MRHLLFASTAVLAIALCAPAQATYVVTLNQVGPDVVATGSGSVDLTALIPFGPAGVQSHVIPMIALLALGSTSFQTTDLYGGISGPTSFGSGGTTPADSGFGGTVSLIGSQSRLSVPAGYVSGSPLGISSATFDNQSFAGLGVTPGTYTWTWGSGADADSFILDIGVPSVPEPLTLSLFAAGLAGIALRRKQA